MSQNGYYSTQSGIQQPGNFGISNVVRVGVQSNVSNYNQTLNNAGLVPQGATVNTNTNVMMGLLDTKTVSGVVVSTNNASVEQQLNAGVTAKLTNVNEYNGNLQNNIVGPKIHLYPNETSVNTYQN